MTHSKESAYQGRISNMEQSSVKEKIEKVDKLEPNISIGRDRKVYTGVAGRLLKYLATGVTQEEASRALGVDASLVSHYVAETDFKEQLSELVGASFKDATAIDNNYVETEKILSKRLKEQAEFMMNPDQVIRTLKFVNEAKKKISVNHANSGNGSNGEGGIRPVVLILPTIIREKLHNEFILNPNNEIVGVNGEVLETLNSASLNSMVQARKAKALAAPKEVGKLNGTNSNQAKDPYSDL